MNMFYRYEIKNKNNEDVLYLFLTMSYEFSKELGSTTSNEKLTKRCKNFIKNNSIDFKGNKVYLVIDDIIVKSLDIKNLNDDIELLDNDNDFSDDNCTLTIKLDNNVLIEVKLRDYLLGCLATNALTNLEDETLKCLCILYRTFALSYKTGNKVIPATNEYIIYRPISYYKLLWITEYNRIYNKLLDATIKTDKHFITYKNNFILPFTHITNNGYTSTLENFPYLIKRPSLWDYASTYYLNIKDISYNDLEKKLNINKDLLTDIDILELNSSNCIKLIKIGEQIFEGEKLKQLLDLNSTDLTIIVNNDFIRFISRGKGSCLGLSQFGANELSKNDCNYIQILKYYFPTCEVKKYK